MSEPIRVELDGEEIVFRVPLASLPKIVQDKDGHLKVDGLDSLEFVGSIQSITQYDTAANWNRQPAHEFKKVLAHLAFGIHYLTHKRDSAA